MPEMFSRHHLASPTGSLISSSGLNSALNMTNPASTTLKKVSLSLHRLFTLEVGQLTTSGGLAIIYTRSRHVGLKIVHVNATGRASLPVGLKI